MRVTYVYYYLNIGYCMNESNICAVIPQSKLIQSSIERKKGRMRGERTPSEGRDLKYIKEFGDFLRVGIIHGNGEMIDLSVRA